MNFVGLNYVFFERKLAISERASMLLCQFGLEVNLLPSLLTVLCFASLWPQTEQGSFLWEKLSWKLCSSTATGDANRHSVPGTRLRKQDLWGGHQTPAPAASFHSPAPTGTAGYGHSGWLQPDLTSPITKPCPLEPHPLVS